MGRKALFRAHIEMEGVPPHVWNLSTAASLLGPACSIERLGTTTASKEDLGHFSVFAWTSDPCLIPREKTLQIPEAPAVDDEEDDLMLLPEMIIPSEVNLLEYRVFVHLLRVEDSSASTDRSSSEDWPSDKGDSGHDGDPDRGYGDRRPAKGTRQNFFRCSRGRVDEDDFGDHPHGFRRVAAGVQRGAASARVASRLSAEAPAFTPARRGTVVLPADPLLAWSAPPPLADVGWDPMLLEASASAAAVGSPEPAGGFPLSVSRDLDLDLPVLSSLGISRMWCFRHSLRDP